MYGQQREDRKLQITRIHVVAVVITIIFLVMVGRLWYLQVALGAELLKQSESNRLKLLRTRAPRGTILDRKGKVLATSRPQFVVMAVPETLRENKEAMQTLCDILQIKPKDLEDTVKKSSARPGSPVRIAVDVPLDIVARIGELRMKLPGVSVDLDNLRHYPDGPAVAHVMGYIGEIDEKELKSAREAGLGYQPGDYVGKAGIEKQYEKYLRGKDGGKQVEVNAFGRVIRTMGERPSVPGSTLKLTIDRDLQVAAYRAFGPHRGGIVAMNPKTGGVLALVSSPSYDPNAFVKRLSSDVWKEITKKKALQNRAVSSTYPPGSTFKPFMSIAGLIYGECDLDTTVSCPGYFVYGGRRGCWKRHGPGVDFNRAIAESCNVWFYKLSLKLGVDRIAKVMRQFGLSYETGIDLPHEGNDDGSLGIIPDTQWKKERFKNNPAQQTWFPGETPSVGIGQGYVETSALQMAVATGAIATKGKVVIPHLADRVIGRNDKILYKAKTEFKDPVNASDEIFEKVITAMRQTVTAGTGRIVNLEDVPMAAKTGSAQNPHGVAHGWFICFGPTNDPEIVIAGIVENGAHGSTSAGPISRAILDVYYGNKTPEEIEAVVLVP